MAIELVVEVLDHAPDDMTPAEMLVLVAIAERANPRTRIAYPSKKTKPWSLAQRCRLSPTGLRSALQRLAARGLEVRIQIATDKSDRPVFACRNRQTDYRLPTLKGDASSSPSSTGKATPQHHEGDASSSPIGPKGDASSSPRTSRGTSSDRQGRSGGSEGLPPAARIAALFGIEEEDARTIIDKIRAEHGGIRSMGAYLSTLIANGDIESWRPRPAAAYTGPRCDFAPDDDTPDVCKRCGIPKAHARHRTGGAPC